jgi:hypothetical protein
MTHPDLISTASVFEHPGNGYREAVPSRAWLWMMLFGVIYMAVRGLWRDLGFGLLFIIIATLVFWPFGVVVAFVFWIYYVLNATDTLRQNYLRRGWREVKM